ncbi:MAG: hypothetical protein IKN72_08585 [Clostridia bacterium]|nr:hypothetical protein [Clostridia bacterium]
MYREDTYPDSPDDPYRPIYWYQVHPDLKSKKLIWSFDDLDEALEYLKELMDAGHPEAFVAVYDITPGFNSRILQQYWRLDENGDLVPTEYQEPEAR